MTSFFGRLSYIIIGKKTKEQKEQRRIDIIKELLATKRVQYDATEPTGHVKNVLDDHLLDSVIVSKLDGTVLMSSASSVPDSEKSSQIYNFLSDNFPEAQIFSIRENGSYNIIYLQDELVYLMKSSSDLSALEAKQITKKLDLGLDKFSLR